MDHQDRRVEHIRFALGSAGCPACIAERLAKVPMDGWQNGPSKRQSAIRAVERRIATDGGSTLDIAVSNGHLR